MGVTLTHTNLRYRLALERDNLAVFSPEHFLDMLGGRGRGWDCCCRSSDEMTNKERRKSH